MWRRAIAESLFARLNIRPGIQLHFEPDYTRAELCIKKYNAEVALIEAAESGVHDVSQCLEICEKVRKETEYCKLILMCPDKDEEAVAQTVNAMQDGRIDDFIFYEASFDYISSKILTMLNN